MTDPRIQPFLELLKKWGSAYTTCVASTLTAEEHITLAGRIVLGGSMPDPRGDLSAGGLHFRQRQIAPPSLDEMESIVTQAAITIDGQELRLPREPSGSGIGYYFRAHDAPGQPRYMPQTPILRMTGASMATVFGTRGGIDALTRALQTNDPPYDGLEDLRDELALQSPLGNRDDSFLELCLAPPLAINEASVDVEGRVCVTIDAARDVDLSSFQLGVRALRGLSVLHRIGLHSSDATVVETAGSRRMTFERTFRDADAVDLLVAQAGALIARTRLEPDLVRARAIPIAIGQIDPGFTQLRRLVLDFLQLPRKDQNSRAFEGGIAVLLSVLSLRTVPLCAFPPYGQSADVCAWVPGGPMLLVEASVETVLSDTPKIELLADRAVKLSRALQSEGHTTAVVPVFATPHATPDADEGRSVVEQHEVALLDKEPLRELFVRLDAGVRPIDTARFIATRVPIRDPFRAAIRDMTRMGMRGEPLDEDE